ncbi:hypothetical protein C6P44_000610 [Monosporozyma unispora]|nr:hypothetical protein C6P44_000610 [Kazachstania unispora]
MKLISTVLTSLVHLIPIVKGLEDTNVTKELDSNTKNLSTLCTSYNLDLKIMDTSSVQCIKDNYNQLQDCIISNFNEGSKFCTFCVLVNPNSLEDDSNCECIKCVMNAVTNNNCFQEVCNGKLAEFQEFVDNNNDNVEVKERIFNKYSTELKQNDQLQYLTDDETGTIFRNFLPFEQINLVQSLLNYWVDNQSPQTLTQDAANEVDIKEDIKEEENKMEEGDQLVQPDWWKKKKKVYITVTETATDTETEWKYKVKTKIKPILKPTTTTKIVYKTKGLITETETETETEHEVKTKTDYDVKYKCKTKTETETEAEIRWKTKYETEFDTEYIKKWKTKTEAKFIFVTLTETDMKVSTRTRYRHDIVTATETEVDEFTKTVLIPRTTTTSTKFKLKFKKKTITDTTTTTSLSISTKWKKRLASTTTQTTTTTTVSTKKKFKVTKTKLLTTTTTTTTTVGQVGAVRRRRGGRLIFRTDRTATLFRRQLHPLNTSTVELKLNKDNTTSYKNITVITPMNNISNNTPVEIVVTSGASRNMIFGKISSKVLYTISLSSLVVLTLAFYTPRIGKKQLKDGSSNKKKPSSKEAHFEDFVVNLGVD